MKFDSDPIERWFASRGWTPFDFQREVWDAYRAARAGSFTRRPAPGRRSPPGAARCWSGSMSTCARRDAQADLRREDRHAAAARALDHATPRARRRHRGSTPPATRRSRHPVDARVPNRRHVRRAARPTAPPTADGAHHHARVTLAAAHPRATRAEIFADLRAVVVDEWHELMGTKRGVHVELALARLRFHQPPLRTWGLSATIGNLDRRRQRPARR